MSFTKLNLISPFGIQIEIKKWNSLNFQELQNLLLDFSLIVIKNCPLDKEELINFSANLSFKKGDLKSKLLHWDFGPIMEMKFDPFSPNYLFSQEKVPFHWDGAFHLEPQFLMFKCNNTSGWGGETLFSNTSHILDNELKDKHKLLKKTSLRFSTEKKAHYGGEIETNLFQTHPYKNTNILRFAEEVKTSLNPVKMTIKSEEWQESINIYNEILDHVYSQNYCYEHNWQINDLLLVDNFTCIHGRNELKENTNRSFYRIQIM